MGNRRYLFICSTVHICENLSVSTRVGLELWESWSFPIHVLQASRGGQSVSLVGGNLVIFGGQDAKRSLLNDLHILDLETMTWDEIDAV